MKKTLLSCLFLTLLLIVNGCMNDSEDSDHNMVYLHPGLDHGLMQSPINILSKATTPGRHNITLHFTGEINRVENLGHTIQLDFKPGSTITFDDKTYVFKQLHFHTPSEHLIDGMTFPMEMHIVNTLQHPAKDTVPEYFVLAYLFKMGDENKFINSFLDLVPAGANQEKAVEVNLLEAFDADTIQMSAVLQSYYHYKGSLTTPPYTESVNWFVLDKIFEASPEQILQINELEKDNARHIQAIYGRKIERE